VCSDDTRHRCDVRRWRAVWNLCSPIEAQSGHADRVPGGLTVIADARDCEPFLRIDWHLTM
jgi:hypothetical protein